MGDNSDITTQQLQERILGILGATPWDRNLWDVHHLEIFALSTSMMQARHQRPADKWESTEKRNQVLAAFDRFFWVAATAPWTPETRVLWSLRIAIRNQF